MNNLTSITIITTVFNGVNNIESTILSVLNFSNFKIEYIIIDGASTDGTIDIIKKYQHQLKYWISEPDSGIYDAMNKGWMQANDKSYILFLGAGDFIIQLPDMSKYTEADIIFGKVNIGDKYIFYSKADFRLRLINCIHHQAELIKKSVHPLPPFSLNYSVFSDFDFNQRLYKANLRFSYDKEFFTYALPGGISAQTHKKEMLDIVKKNFGIFYCLIAKIYYLFLDYKNTKKEYN